MSIQPPKEERRGGRPKRTDTSQSSGNDNVMFTTEIEEDAEYMLHEWALLTKTGP